jgi:hypothetical protein
LDGKKHKNSNNIFFNFNQYSWLIAKKNNWQHYSVIICE